MESNPSDIFALKPPFAERERFRQKLLLWYEENRRDLPWRDTKDPYRIWVSEVMAQQTRIGTMAPYYERFVGRFPTIGELARADLQDVLKVWERLGYYERARNLHRSARILAKRSPCEVPRRKSELLKLPGIGEYTASAIASIAFGQPTAAVDANVCRVLSRLFRLKAPIGRSSSAGGFRAAADSLISASRPGDFNQAMMELGALVCLPRRPVCSSCPVRLFCGAYRGDAVAQFPVRLRPKSIPTRNVAVAVIVRRNRLLITKRKKEGLLGGMWEFPGGKIEEGESPRKACLREVEEEVDLLVKVERPIKTFAYAYTHFRVNMHVFSCRFVSGRVRLNSPVAYRWIRLSQLDRFPLPGANRRFVPALAEILGSQ